MREAALKKRGPPEAEMGDREMKGQRRKMSEQAWRLLILCIFWWMAAAPDFRSRAIPVWIPIIFLLAAVIADALLPTSIDKKLLWSGAVPGGILLFLTLVSKGKIGEGDGICLLTGGLIAGVSRILIILQGALVMVSLTGIFMIAAKRGRAEDRIAFLPFLAISAGVAFLVELTC